MKRKTLETAVIAAALAASLLTGCSKPAEETTAAAEKQESKADAGQEKKESPEKLEELTVGASPAPHAEILEAADVYKRQVIQGRERCRSRSSFWNTSDAPLLPKT